MLGIKTPVFGAFVLAFSTIACANPGKVTGGGQLINHDGDRTANFGFNADTCAGDIKDPRGHFNYNDQGNGVRMNGELKAAAECVSPDQWEGQWFAPACVICKAILGVPSYLVRFEYRSTNPAYPGEGDGFACAADNGEGANAEYPDKLFLKVTSGPFEHYVNYGKVQGNIQAHACHNGGD